MVITGMAEMSAFVMVGTSASCGRELRMASTFSRTSAAAVGRSVPSSNSSDTTEMPSCELDTTFFRFATELTASSIGLVISVSIS